MLKNERQTQIVDILINHDKYVTVKELCKMLYASESSIRRDLTALETKGIIKRSYGGAELVTNFSRVTSFNTRYNHNVAAKKAIAKKAASLIKDSSVIFLDQSSTAFFLATEILDKSSLTIVTNNIEIMNLISGTAINLIASGGMLSTHNRTCFVGQDAERTFENIYADFVFFSTKSISYDGSIWDISKSEVDVRRPMIKNASKKIFLCDSEKFGTHSPHKQCTLHDVDYLIAESEDALQFAKAANNLTIK